MKTIQQNDNLRRQPTDRAARINAGYVRLLRAILKTPLPAKGQGPRRASRGPKPEGRRPTRCDGAAARPAFKAQRSSARHPAAVDYLARFLCAGFALALMATGCAIAPLKGGKAVTTHKPAGVIEQTLQQGESAAGTTKQDQEVVKVRTYTVPTGSRLEQSHAPGSLPSQTASVSRDSQASPLTPQLSTTYVLSAPMPVEEREERRSQTELGAAQKDTARELGAKLSSLKGIVWVGAGLFVLGLASLVWPPLKVVVGSVTTSAALMLGGVALMILPTMVAGNEPLILGVVALAVGGWFLAHRHGELRGVVAATTANPGAKAVKSNQ